MQSKSITKKENSKYNMWQNTGFMLRNAWESCKSVIFLCILLAVVSAGKTAAELLIAPMILEKVEGTAAFSELIGTILLFGISLMFLSGLKIYLDNNTMYGRVYVRTSVMRQIGIKLARTSYPNLLDTSFLSMQEKAFRTCGSNIDAAEAIWTTWTNILTNVLGFVVYLLLLLNLDFRLICLVIVTTAVGYYTNKRILEWDYKHREEAAALSKRIRYIQDFSVQRQQAKDIRIFGLRSWLEDLWSSALRLYLAFSARQQKQYFFTNLVDLILTFLRNGAAYAYLIWLTLDQGLPAWEFLLYFSTVGGFTQWVTGILEKFTELHKQSLELTSLREFLEWPEPFQFEEGTPLPQNHDKDYELRMENVSFRYPGTDKDTLSHINLTIHPGENLAIVGLNGAGKTTLVKLLCGFLDPTEGTILLNGIDIRTYNRRDYYALFAAVFQDFSVLEASLAENVAQQVYGIDRERVNLCLDQAGLTEKVQSLHHGIDTKIGRQVYEDGVELSGGQTQRMMLARALYKDAPILLLDEPTAALDPIAENDIYLKYNEMTRNKTSLFISHRLASTRFCDRILFLEDGAITEEGTHESLLALGNGYANLFHVQSRYYQEGGNTFEETEQAE